MELGYADIEGVGKAKVLMYLEKPPLSNDNLTVVLPVEFGSEFEALKAIDEYRKKRISATYKGKKYIIGKYKGSGKVEDTNAYRPHIGFNLK